MDGKVLRRRATDPLKKSMGKISAMAHAEQEFMDSLRNADVCDMESRNVASEDDRNERGPGHDAKALYFGLLQGQPDPSALLQSRYFLARQLEVARDATADLPDDVEDLAAWMESNTAAVGRQYRDYLAERKDGGPRQYFPTKSHALHFLKAVAPTKLVDGAWLYGLVSQWRDARCAQLIRIYLEELGEGEPDMNHVLLYKKLLAAHECEQWQSMDETHFVQGAIQLSLARHAHQFLPEVIGFNLGYEQLPLHLLICAYELNELGIDPFYFTLHVTVDNAASGHAARAVQSVADAMPRLGDRKSFYRRVRNGYQLNSLGAGTNDVIASFDLERELFDVLGSKALFGAHLHSDYCRIAGKSVNDWLSTPGQIRGFVEALEKAGWIRRHEQPENSRFWNLLVGDKAPMFGVFNAYERQVIHDWIAGRSLQHSKNANARYRNRNRNWTVNPRPEEAPHAVSASAWSRYLGAGVRQADDFAAESRLLRDQLASASNKGAAMDLLVPWLSPGHHHTAVGLMATRIFSQWLRA